MIFYLSILVFLINCLLTSFLMPFFEKYFLDSPNKRSSHKKPIPTGAGIIFVITTISVSFFLDWEIPLMCLPLAVIGFLDDKFNLPKILRYIVHILTGLVIANYVFKLNVNQELISDTFWLNVLLILFLIFIITAIINFSNFMDGIDGLLGSTFCVSFLFISFTFNPSVMVLAFALSSFLLFNWHPAKVFMGDAGSTFLGAVYAGVVLEDGDIKQIITKLLIMSPIFLDSFFTLIRRIIYKHSFFMPHKLHLYQRLNQSGMSHQNISLIYLLGVIFLCLIALFNNLYILFFSVAIVFVVGIFLNSIAVPFKK